MTTKRIPATKLRKVRKLAAAYYTALQELEIEYIEPWVNRETYTINGVLDKDAYKAALEELVAFSRTKDARYKFVMPTKDGGYIVANEPLFGYYSAHARATVLELNKETSND